jgi:hypothetical protein
MKTVLAIWHSANKGKTETLREFANLLLSTYPNNNPIFPIPVFVPNDADFRLVVEISGKIIAIESKGDPNTNLQERLIDLSDNFHCDIILCSCRTRGETIAAVNTLTNSRDFQTIWTSTYQIPRRPNQDTVNRLKAKHLLELLQTLELL